MPRLRHALLLPALVTAAFAAPTPARAQDMADYDYENLVLSGVGVHLAQVFPSRAEPTLSLNVRADLGLLGPNVRITPGVSFWATEMREAEVEQMEQRIEAACDRGGVPCPGIELGDIEISDMVLDVDAHYLWTTDYFVEPYAGVGISLHLLNGRGDFIDDTFVEELLDAIAPGLNLVGGLEFPIAGNLRVLGEARGVITGNTRFISVGVGAAWRFPPALQRPVIPPPPPASNTGGR